MTRMWTACAAHEAFDAVTYGTGSRELMPHPFSRNSSAVGLPIIAREFVRVSPETVASLIASAILSFSLDVIMANAIFILNIKAFEYLVLKADIINCFRIA